VISGGTYSKMNFTLIPTSQYADATVQAGQTYYYVAASVDSTNHESP
jgi:fibronectin type 3 domain-containing protein